MATAQVTPLVIDDKRWAKVLAKGLDQGAHDSFSKGVCAMEAAAYIANEPFSDHPKCVSPVIGAFMRSWNDALPDAERALILPLIPLTIGTVASPEIEERRAMMAIDWYIREHVPAWLRLAGLTKDADTLAGLGELTAQAQMVGIRAPLEAIRDNASAAESAAWSAARSAAGSAAGSAAWSAAGSAAWSAAWSAAGSAAWSAARSAAWSAARSAAWSAARSAARSAAWSAARSALSEPRTALQQSAVKLVERMCALSDGAA